jgi:hypothetical protein
MSFNKQQKVKKLKERATNIFTTFFSNNEWRYYNKFFSLFQEKNQKGELSPYNF